MAQLKAFLIDDNQVNLRQMQKYTGLLNLDVISFSQPLDALCQAADIDPDIVLVNERLPGMDGIEFITAFREYNIKSPVIMITDVNVDEKVKLSALRAGATEFLYRPLNYMEFFLRISNLLRLKQYQNRIGIKATKLEEKVKRDAQVLTDSERETLFVLAKTADHKDPDTGMHIMRVANYSKLLAEFIHADKDLVEMIYYCAPLHDVGKVGIPDRILQKQGKLTEEEFSIMKQHTVIGFDILDNTRSKYLAVGKKIAISHHEKYNGTGYPYGLAGEEIPIEGRIVAIADVFDALLSRRPYKKPWGFNEAADYMVFQKGLHFDPVMVEAFVENIGRIREVFENYRDDAEHPLEKIAASPFLMPDEI